MLQPSRTYSAGNQYRYGFNGKEQDNEISDQGNQYDYGFRIYNARLGRFLSVDPLTGNYPMLTSYQFASNTPIQAIDLDGLEAVYPQPGMGTKSEIQATDSKIVETRVYASNMGAVVYKLEGDKYSISHQFNNVTTSIEYNTLNQVGNNNAWAMKHLFSAPYARKVSTTISGIEPYKSQNSVLNTFGNFIAPKIFDVNSKDFEKNKRNDISQGYSKVFRHQTWQAIFTVLEGASYAEELGNAQEFENLRGTNEEKRQHSFRDIINNYYGRQIGLSLKNSGIDLSKKEDLVKLLNTVASQVIGSFKELSSKVSENQRQIFTIDSPGVDELFKAINPPKPESNIDHR